MAIPKFRELWTVKVSTRDEFQLTGEQFQVLRDRMSAGDLGIFDMPEGGFKISQIVCWRLESRQIENQLPAGNTEHILTDEERAKARKKIKQVRESLRGVLI
jgi:hypothetical protein